MDRLMMHWNKMVNSRASYVRPSSWQASGLRYFAAMTRPGHLSVLLLTIAIVGCFARQADTGTGAVHAPDPDDASELALLMRAMAAHVDSVKATMSRGTDLPAFPEEFAKLFTATPTEGMHIDPITYPTFGRDYLAKLDLLYASDAQERPRLYNALVQSCANCHGTHCPGPLMRIRKMYVELE